MSEELFAIECSCGTRFPYEVIEGRIGELQQVLRTLEIVQIFRRTLCDQLTTPLRVKTKHGFEFAADEHDPFTHRLWIIGESRKVYDVIGTVCVACQRRSEVEWNTKVCKWLCSECCSHY